MKIICYVSLSPTKMYMKLRARMKPDMINQ